MGGREKTKKMAWELGSDLPLTDPATDEFGYAPFASRIASAIVGNRKPQGLVLAVHGEWGSGKSSMMNFIQHGLRNLPSEQRPVLVDFNPWWFEGREQIARQLLEQFSAQLTDRLKPLRKLAKVVDRYASEIAATTATSTGHVWAAKPLAVGMRGLANLAVLKEKTSIPDIKKQVGDALLKSGKRFVFFVDDIDRLTPDEARDFFRAIKALADFPEVVYVLFFDRVQVADAISASMAIDGEAYLEKIVQAPFHLPAVDKGQLSAKLFKGLDAILESKPMPFPFDQGRWSEIWQEGLERILRKPRDIVRILNAISVGYPAMAGEVNPVDFVALEFLRVFEPAIYDGVREDKDMFCGAGAQRDPQRASEAAYFARWKESLPAGSRDWLARVVGLVFPKVAQALDRFAFVSNGREWRKELRPCSPDCFGVYFQLGVPPGHVSRAELDRLLSARSSQEMAALMVEAQAHVLPDGHSKARDLIDRLRDFDELESGPAAMLIEALVSHAHELLRPEDERGGFFSLPNRWRIFGVVTRLLERLGVPDRQALMTRLAERSSGLWGLVSLAEEALTGKRDPSRASQAMIELDDGFADALAEIVRGRLSRATLGDFIAMPELYFFGRHSNHWVDGPHMRSVFAPMLETDDALLALLDKFVSTGSTSSGNKTTETYRLFMNALALAVDIPAIEPRIAAMQAREGLTARQAGALRSFARGVRLVAKGRDPDAFDEDDD